MTDDAIKNALARKAALEAELRVIEQFLSLHRQFANLHEDSPRASLPLFISNGGEPGTDMLGGAEHDGNPPRKLGPVEYADMAEEFIRRAGHPLTRSELVTAFDKDNVELPSPDKARYLGTILWRSRARFPNVPGYGYTVADLLTPAQRDRIEQSLRSADVPDDVRNTLSLIAQRWVGKPPLPAGAIIEAWETTQQIPSEVDRHLLADGRTELGSDLSVAEKRFLRQAFIDRLRRVHSHLTMLR